jgi:hypothetical protein
MLFFLSLVLVIFTLAKRFPIVNWEEYQFFYPPFVQYFTISVWEKLPRGAWVMGDFTQKWQN